MATEQATTAAKSLNFFKTALDAALAYNASNNSVKKAALESAAPKPVQYNVNPQGQATSSVVTGNGFDSKWLMYGGIALALGGLAYMGLKK